MKWLLPIPTRRCLKNTGPGDVTRMIAEKDQQQRQQREQRHKR